MLVCIPSRLRFFPFFPQLGLCTGDLFKDKSCVPHAMTDASMHSARRQTRRDHQYCQALVGTSKRIFSFFRWLLASKKKAAMQRLVLSARMQVSTHLPCPMEGMRQPCTTFKHLLLLPWPRRMSQDQNISLFLAQTVDRTLVLDTKG